MEPSNPQTEGFPSANTSELRSILLSTVSFVMMPLLASGDSQPLGTYRPHISDLPKQSP
jgi:hypothetical protein